MEGVAPEHAYIPCMVRPPVTLEICVDSLQGALAAEQGGADRVELCDNLAEGGTTPSGGMIAEVVGRLSIPVFVMVRPRGGDFALSSDEVAIMLRDIALAQACGARGIVTGVLETDGRVHAVRMRELVRAAAPLPVTFHRAFDVVEDAEDAMAALARVGVRRILTSGQAPSAAEGAPRLAQLVERAPQGITIVAAGGITEDNAAELVRSTGVSEIHARGTVPVASRMSYRRPGISFVKPVLENDVRAVTDVARVRRLRAVLGDGGPA